MARLTGQSRFLGYSDSDASIGQDMDVESQALFTPVIRSRSFD